MKQYVISRIIMTIEFIVVLSFIIFGISKETFSFSTLSVALNTDYEKSIDSKIIKETQSELYKQGIYNPLYTFTGDLTGYAGDCPLCSGYLACPPRTNVLKEGIYYNDKTYGTVRIVASSRNYPCGTIIRFKVNKLSKEPIYAIILDRGVGGNDIDLLTENEDFARKKVGRVRNTTFEVIREGWKK